MGILSNRVEESDLTAGDHIYTWRMLLTHAHHGIYMGQGRVVHFTKCSSLATPARCSACDKIKGSRSSGGGCEGVVLVSCLNCFLARDSLYRYEYNVKKLYYWFKIPSGPWSTQEPSPPHIGVKSASYLLRKGFGYYDVVNNNCQDFAMFCKTAQKTPKF